MGFIHCVRAKAKRILLLRCNYWKLNANTVRNSHLILRMEERIDSLGDAKTFAALPQSQHWLVADINERRPQRHDGFRHAARANAVQAIAFEGEK